MGGSRREDPSATLRQQRVAMPEILDAMTSSRDDPSRYFVDLEQGGVVVVMDEAFSGEVDDEISAAIDEEPQRYAEIPRVESRDQYDLMCEFAARVDEDDIRDKLELALRGKGAFGRFRDVVFDYPDLKASWIAMRQAALVEQAKRWLDGLGIEAVYELRPATTAPSDASEPAGEKIQLLDLLLLGAPDGQTELIGGRVSRQINARSESEARALFKSLARQLCAFQGLPWRKRYIDGRSDFELERFHLRVEGTLVELDVDMPRATWNAFA